MTVTGHCEPIDCANCGSERFFYGHYGWEPFGGCEGDPVPHSDVCEQSGGKGDLDVFLEGEWLEFTETPDSDPMDWTCDCVREHWNGREREHWTTAYAQHHGISVIDAHRQFQLAHAAWTHQQTKKEMKDA